MVGVGGKAPLRKNRRVPHDPVKAEFFHGNILLKFFVDCVYYTENDALRQPFGGGRASKKRAAYLTAPVMPSANCFCRMKKMITVGSEQNRTPIISMP